MKKVLILAVAAIILVGTLFAGTTQVLADTTLEDGRYTVEFTFDGGTGKGGVEAVEADVKGGEIETLYLTMTSEHYDYCIYYGEKYEAPAGEGNSVFTVPYVEDQFLLTADTTAMSQPHEIDYNVTLDTASMAKIGGDEPADSSSGNKKGIIIGLVVLACLIVVFFAVKASRRKAQTK